MSALFEHKKQLWKSIKDQFIEKLKTPSTADSFATASNASDSDSNLDTEDDSLTNLSPIEVTPKTFIGLASPADVHPDPTWPASTSPLHSESNGTHVAHN